LQRKATSCKRQRQRLGVGSFLLKFKQITLINIHQQCPATTMGSIYNKLYIYISSQHYKYSVYVYMYIHIFIYV
jgi:hypothetical protein